MAQAKGNSPEELPGKEQECPPTLTAPLLGSERFTIARGDFPIHLTRDEALELAGILTAAAMEEE